MLVHNFLIHGREPFLKVHTAPLCVVAHISVLALQYTWLTSFELLVDDDTCLFVVPQSYPEAEEQDEDWSDTEGDTHDSDLLQQQMLNLRVSVTRTQHTHTNTHTHTSAHARVFPIHLYFQTLVVVSCHQKTTIVPMFCSRITWPEPWAPTKLSPVKHSHPSNSTGPNQVRVSSFGQLPDIYLI